MQNGVQHTNAVERELSSLSPNSFSFLKLSDPGKEGGVAAVCDMLQSIDTEKLSLFVACTSYCIPLYHTMYIFFALLEYTVLLSFISVLISIQEAVGQTERSYCFAETWVLFTQVAVWCDHLIRLLKYTYNKATNNMDALFTIQKRWIRPAQNLRKIHKWEEIIRDYWLVRSELHFQLMKGCYCPWCLRSMPLSF